MGHGHGKQPLRPYLFRISGLANGMDGNSKVYV